MKTVKISFMDKAIRNVVPDDTPYDVDDGADFFDVLARIDEIYMKGPIKAKRGETVVRSILQLVWNAHIKEVYEDIGLEARDPEKNWVPVRSDPQATVPDGTSIMITTDPGC
jgi:hypothetical protein